MQGSTHLAGGLLVGAALAGGSPIGLAAAGMAALIPDWIQINIPGANKIARGIVGHRGLSHWVLMALGLWGVIRAINPDLALYVLVGWLSHIMLDLCSGGTAAFWPWPGRIVLGNIKTGSRSDVWIGAACLALACIILIGRTLK